MAEMDLTAQGRYLIAHVLHHPAEIAFETQPGLHADDQEVDDIWKVPLHPGFPLIDPPAE